MARPTSDVVLKAYLGALIPELGGGARLATTLPEDRTVWAAAGFVTFGVVGGTPNSEVMQRRPVFGLQCWANAGDSPKPPWGKAASLAEAIVDLGERRDTGRLFGAAQPTNGAPFDPFVVTHFRVLTEPRKLIDSGSAYARFVLDVELWWSPLDA